MSFACTGWKMLAYWASFGIQVPCYKKVYQFFPTASTRHLSEFFLDVLATVELLVGRFTGVILASITWNRTTQWSLVQVPDAQNSKQ